MIDISDEEYNKLPNELQKQLRTRNHKKKKDSMRNRLISLMGNSNLYSLDYLLIEAYKTYGAIWKRNSLTTILSVMVREGSIKRTKDDYYKLL